MEDMGEKCNTKSSQKVLILSTFVRIQRNCKLYEIDKVHT